MEPGYKLEVDGRGFEINSPVVTSNYLLSLVEKDDGKHILILVAQNNVPRWHWFGQHEPTYLSTGYKEFEVFPYNC